MTQSQKVNISPFVILMLRLSFPSSRLVGWKYSNHLIGAPYHAPVAFTLGNYCMGTPQYIITFRANFKATNPPGPLRISPSPPCAGGHDDDINLNGDHHE